MADYVLVVRKCFGCTLTFKVLPTSPQKYCSDTCWYINEGKRERAKEVGLRRAARRALRQGPLT